MGWGAGILLLLIVAGLVLLIVGLRGRRVSDHPHCRRCGFDLIGATLRAARPCGPSPLCPECGAQLDARVPGSKPRPIRRGRRRRRPHFIAIGVILLSFLGVPLALTHTGQWTRFNPRKPFGVLQLDIRIGSNTVKRAALAELESRILNSRVSSAEARALADLSLRVQADRSRPWDPGWGNIIAATDQMRFTDPSVFTAYAGEGVRGLSLPDRIVWIRDEASGVHYFPEPQLASTWGVTLRLGSASNASILCAVELLDASLDGTALGLYDLTSALAEWRSSHGITEVRLPFLVLNAQGSQQTGSNMYAIEARERQLGEPIWTHHGKPLAHPHGQLLEEASPGEHELVIRWRQYFARGQFHSDPLASQDVETTTTFELIGDVNDLYAGTITREEVTPEQYGALRWAATIDAIWYAPGGLGTPRNHPPTVDLASSGGWWNSSPPFAISAAVEIEVEGKRWTIRRGPGLTSAGEPLRLGRTPSTSSDIVPRGGVLDRPLPEGIERVDVVLVPDPAGAAEAAAQDRQRGLPPVRRWASEIVIKDVPVRIRE
ncbi:MAG: hypothetical protein R3B57_02040 [Phycisphaerales bacterium]